MFKGLIKKIDETYKDDHIDIDLIYSLGWDDFGPWNKVAEIIKKDLEETGFMKDKIEQLTEK